MSVVTLIYGSHRVVINGMRLTLWMHTTTVQALVHYLSLVSELSRIGLLSTYHAFLLTIFHILKALLRPKERTYLDLLLCSHLWHTLTSVIPLSC